VLKSMGLGLAMAAVVGGGAGAQEAACSALLAQGCTCAAPIVAGSAVGQLSGVQGNVVVSGRANFTPINVPTGLSAGDGILIGPNSTALVTMGANCENHALPANTSASITQMNGCACLTVQSNPTTGALPGNGNVVGFATQAGFWATVLLLSHRHTPAPPVSAP
jgi:hypothetical protein